MEDVEQLGALAGTVQVCTQTPEEWQGRQRWDSALNRSPVVSSLAGCIEKSCCPTG